MPLTPSQLFAHLAEPSTHGIADHLAKLIRAGDLETGTALPPVRDIAAVLHVSPATISGAWGLLRRQNLIEGRGRQGSRVVETIRTPGPRRFENIDRFWAKGTLNVSWAVPDRVLLPDLPAAIAASGADPDFNTYNRPDITPALRAAVAPAWPFPAQRWLAVDGGYEGLRLVLSSIVLPGDYVAVSDPSTPRILDILDHVGARPIPVPTDTEGPTVDGLDRALRRNPRVFLYEPRASSRLGVTMSAARRDALVELLAGGDTVIVEDDGTGDVAEGRYAGIGAKLPDRSVLVKSYSKSHGPDLRLAVIGGATDIVDRTQATLQFGSGWTSRLLQNALAHMLTDEAAIAEVSRARQIYTQRRERMIALLAARGITIAVHDGLSLSVPAENDLQALLVLASHGIASDSTRTSSIRSEDRSVRLSTAHDFGEDAERIADAFALAARAR